MKLQHFKAVWHLANFLGNVIDMGISGSHIVEDPAIELFVYAGLMFAVMAVFIVLAIRYKYVDPKVFDGDQKSGVGLMTGNAIETPPSLMKSEKQRID
jgi:hypothetical protein